jgi:membrane-associated protease RseP (regulator of RpoE activity)
MTDTRQHDGAPSEVTPEAPEADTETRASEAGEPVYKTGGLRLAALILGVVAVGVVFDWATVWVIIGIVVMIFLHELGHFVTAKWAGMKVTDFFIGFGPRIWSFQRGETQYGFKAIPAGAFVRIIGMNNLDETDPADEARTYRQQSFPKRLLVVSAGSIMHFIQAFVLLMILLTVIGVPGGTLTDEARHDESWRVGNVEKDSAAEAAGLQKGDDIVTFDGKPVSTWDEVTDQIKDHRVGDQVQFQVVRDGETLDLAAELQPRPANVQGGTPGTPFLGLGVQYPKQTISLGSALVQAPQEMGRFVGNTFGSLAHVFSPSGISNMADNVSQAHQEDNNSGSSGSSVSNDDGQNDDRLLSILGVLRLGTAVTEEQGIGGLFVILFAMNVFIGIFNMLPLPPLDGGHAAVAIYERVRSRRNRRYFADATRLLPVTYAVIMVLVVVAVTALYLDAVNPAHF